MDPRSRLALTTTSGVLVALLIGYGLVSAGRWRRRELDRPTTPSVSVPPNVAGPTAGAPPPSPSPTPQELLAVLSPDTDQDGLPDNLESIYKTDPNKNDTDGDGYLDGSEVANGYDPTKPAPGDKVVLALPTPSGPTYTQRYFDRVGLPPSRENLIKSGELEEFVASVNAHGFLPAVRDADLHVVARGGKTAVAAYLDTVSFPQNTRITTVNREDIESAFRVLTEKKDQAPIDRLIAGLNTNSDILQKAPVPREALALQKQYLAATLALKENVALLKNYQTDFIGVLVAASRIDTLRGVFQSVAEGIRELEKQYGIL